MGQKIHPYGYRVGITQPHAARWFANKYQYPQYVFEDFLLKQSLFKNLPVENLPRKRTEDKSETKLVQIKIERFIRNTIKVKLYVTSPETAHELFDTLDFNASKKDSLKPTKSSLANLEAKKQLNSFVLNLQKKALHKKILQLQILKLQNITKKLVMLKTLLNPSAMKQEESLTYSNFTDGKVTAGNGALKLSEELNFISLDKQKLFHLLTKVENSATFYTTQLSKLKNLNSHGFNLLYKLSTVKFGKNQQITTELKKVLAKNILMVKNLEMQLEKNCKNLNSALILKLNHLTTLETQIKKRTKVIEAIEILRTKANVDTVSPAEFGKTISNSFRFAARSKYPVQHFGLYFNKYSVLLGKNLKFANSDEQPDLTFGKEDRKLYLVNLTNMLKTNANRLSIGKNLYKLSVSLLNQRYHLNKLIQFKIQNLIVQYTKTKDKRSLLSIQDLNNSFKQNSTFIQQLESWLTLFTKKLNNPPVTTTQLLIDRIYKIDCYVNKMGTTMNNISSNQSTETISMEKNFIFVNYNIVKQKLIAELLKMEFSLIQGLGSLYGNCYNFDSAKQRNLMPNFDTQLTKTLQLLQNKLHQLKQSYFENADLSRSQGLERNPFAEQSEPQKTDSPNKPTLLETKADQLFSGSNTKTLRLKTALQNLLKTNYENSFVVLQTRRQVYNHIIHRFGGKRKYNQIVTKQKTWTNPFLKFQTEQPTGISQNLLKDNIDLMELLDQLQQKIYQRKPIKTLETRKQKFLVKKAIKKRLKQYLLLMLMNNNTNLASLKNIYNVKTLSKLCENLTDLQTVPKVSVIELVKVHQPKQYAVCLANFVVENLEKRFSFRSTMKKAAEQAMSTANVKGIKIQIAGRLNGAEIARTEWLRDGVVPLQTLRANIDYSYKTAKTIYGILGVKVWLFKEEVKK